MTFGHIAQTNLQLFRQLHDGGFSPAGLELARDAYRLATELYAGLYRGNGKPFICHGVGTASGAVMLGLPEHAVAAGVLHAAYEFGLFPDGREGDGRPDHRAHVRNRVGEAVEALIFDYWQFAWNADAIERLIETDLAERDAVLARLRLANELDDIVDLGAAANPDKFGTVTQKRIGGAIRLARHLGAEDFADSMQQALDENHAGIDVAAAIAGAGRSYRVLPRQRRGIRRLLWWLRRER